MPSPELAAEPSESDGQASVPTRLAKPAQTLSAASTVYTRLTFEPFDPCSRCADNGRQCEGSKGHIEGLDWHWYSVWTFDEESGEWYPNHPVYFEG